MLFSALILVPIDREHDGLEERVDLGHCDETAEVCNVARLGLEEEQQISVFLRLLIVGEEAFLDLCRLVHVARHLLALRRHS
jgi:hypothetical protein